MAFDKYDFLLSRKLTLERRLSFFVLGVRIFGVPSTDFLHRHWLLKRLKQKIQANERTHLEPIPHGFCIERGFISVAEHLESLVDPQIFEI